MATEKLAVGYQIKTMLGKTLTIKSYIAGGGQGDVYVVDYAGTEMALKWYKPNGMGKKPQAFYENIRNNVMHDAPSPEFLWPMDVTEWVGGTFGYVMKLRPEGYYEISSFLLKKAVFKNYTVAVDAALHIVSAFRLLHNLGYSYQDVNDGNFFINPQNGDVLICDNDNVAPNGTDTGILGKPRYMAPEIVMGQKMPDNLTDRFSLSVILFILFCMNHPLEGKRSLVPCMSPAIQKKLYGSDPLFIMDPDNKDNAPDPRVHVNPLAVWPCLPSYMQDIFRRAFCRHAFENPNARPMEMEWIRTLARFRSDIIACPVCEQSGRHNDIFTENGQGCTCDLCGAKVPLPHRLEFSDYSVPALLGSRIYRCQLGICNAEEALNSVAQIGHNDPARPTSLSIKNLTAGTWDAVTPSGKSKAVAPGEFIPLMDGIRFAILGEQITIRANPTTT